jgi:hypothetical protein
MIAFPSAPYKGQTLSGVGSHVGGLGDAELTSTNRASA